MKWIGRQTNQLEGHALSFVPLFSLVECLSGVEGLFVDPRTCRFFSFDGKLSWLHAISCLQTVV